MSSSTEIRPGKPLHSRLRRGAQAIEFALLLPVLMAVTSGIVDYGWYYSQELSVISAVREGARAAAVVDPTLTTYCSAADARLRSSLVAAGLDGTAATITTKTSGTAPDQLITITANVKFSKLLGLVPAPTALKSSVTMRLENQNDRANCGT
jgi:Flp pilus assembly protein TadG